MTDTFNWGIIGPGKIARKFAEDLATLPGARLHAVASRSIERARDFATAFGADHYYADYHELVECPDLHAVYIATPHSSHAENTMLCLNAKIPVLCEKPFAMNAAEVQQMIHAARENDTFLMEALWTRFLPTTLQMLEWIDEGVIGPVISVKADFGFKADYQPEGRLYNPELGGGSLLDVGIYPVFLALLLLGKPKGMLAHAVFSDTGVDEETAIILKYGGGRIAQLHSSIRLMSKTEAFVYGTKGVIHLHPRWHEPTSISLLLPGERPQHMNFDIPYRGYAYETEEVMRCVREGRRESELMPLSFSLDLIQLLDRIRSEIGLRYPGES